MRPAAPTPPFQETLVWKCSRFTRKREHAVAFKSMLRRRGVRVVSITSHTDEDGLDNAAFSYQWLAADAHIQGSTDTSYTLTADDAGKTVKVRVSFTDDAGNEETLTSTARRRWPQQNQRRAAGGGKGTPRTPAAPAQNLTARPEPRP